MHEIKEGLAPVILGSAWITIDKNVRGIKVGKKFICQGKVCMTVSPDFLEAWGATVWVSRGTTEMIPLWLDGRIF